MLQACWKDFLDLIWLAGIVLPNTLDLTRGVHDGCHILWARTYMAHFLGAPSLTLISLSSVCVIPIIFVSCLVLLMDVLSVWYKPFRFFYTIFSSENTTPSPSQFVWYTFGILRAWAELFSDMFWWPASTCYSNCYFQVTPHEWCRVSHNQFMMGLYSTYNSPLIYSWLQWVRETGSVHQQWLWRFQLQWCMVF